MKKFIYTFIFLAFTVSANSQWVQISNGIANNWVTSFALSGSNIFAGTGNGVFLSTNNGQTWSQNALNNKPIESFDISGNIILAGTIVGVYLSTNNGQSWTQTALNNRDVLSVKISGIYFFAGTRNEGVYLSTNYGQNWIQTELNNRTVYSLAVSNNTIFAGTDFATANTGGVFRSTNNGQNWTLTSLVNNYVKSLVVSGSNIFAGGSGVYLSANNGQTWTQIGLNGKSIFSLAISGNNIFAGTDSYGIYVSTNNGQYWFQNNEGLNIYYTRINGLIIANNNIIAGLDNYNNPVWRRPISELLIDPYEWKADIRLTNAPGFSVTSPNNARCIAANGNVIHVVWSDARDNSFDNIYYKRSTDSGVNWGPDTRMANNDTTLGYPSIAVSGAQVHIVWAGLKGISYKRSTNDGTTWGSTIRLTNGNWSSSNYPSVAVSGMQIHVVWEDARNGNLEIYYKRSTDGGISWGAETRLTNNLAASMSASVAVSGSQVHVVWRDSRDHSNGEIYYKRSTNGGISWGADMRLTIINPSGGATTQAPTIAVAGTRVHVVWMDKRDGAEQIYYKHSTDGGVNWIADTRLTFSGYGKYNPSIAVSDFQVHVVWDDASAGNHEIYYKRSPDGGYNWIDSTRLTNYTGTSGDAHIAISGTQLHVIWSDNRDNNQEIYYKRSPNGNSIGIQSISTENPPSFSLSQNYPNPFNPVTKIRFDVPRSENVMIVVYDILGKEITTLVNQHLQPGTYETDWDASIYSSGIYYYKIVSGDFTRTKKMVLIK